MIKTKFKDYEEQIKYYKKIIKEEGSFKIFSYKGFKCIMYRHPWGHWLGYVQITRLSPLLFLNTKSLHNDILVYGGDRLVGFGDGLFTYSKYKKLNKLQKRFFIGFDCGHFNDLIPFLHESTFKEVLKKEGRKKYNEFKAKFPVYSYNHFATYKTIDFVENEIKKIVNQLIKLVNNDKYIKVF